MSLSSVIPSSPDVGSIPLFLVDRTCHILRRHGLELLPVYWLGMIPFLVGAGWYVYRLQTYHATPREITEWTLLLLGLFNWKNFWQWYFCRRLFRLLRQDSNTRERLSLRQIGEIFIRLTIVQVTGVLAAALIPAVPMLLFIAVPLLLIMPAFYSGWTVCCAWDPQESWKRMMQRLIDMLLSQPAVTIAAVLLLTLGWSLLAGNILTLILLLGAALKAGFGYESAFSMTGTYSDGVLFNSTLWTVVLSLSVLVIDPVWKIWAALRIFYKESRTSGWDLRARLRQVRCSAGLLFLLLLTLFSLPANAEESRTITPEQFKTQIDRTMTRLEFRWRQPTPPQYRTESWLKVCLNSLGETIVSWLKSFAEFLRSMTNHRDKAGNPGELNWSPLLELTAKILLILVIIALGIYLVYFYRKRQKWQLPAAPQTLIRTTPNLNSAEVCADELEQNEWRQLAHELMRDGKFQPAVRALYLSGIATLAEHRLVTVIRGKTDSEYLRELQRRQHALPEIGPLFAASVTGFQQVWYGDYPANQTTVQDFDARLEKLQQMLTGTTT